MSKPKAHSNEDWHRQDILAEVRKRGISLAELGRQHGYGNPRTIYNVFRVPYPKAERIIADFLGVKPEEIWPSRYEGKRAPKFNTVVTSNNKPSQRAVA